ncbi:MAG: non-canonical purine NTP pyrophosphatase, partial [Clostridiales bacterium]|nr:non-canonical purine NTP pyrophosphatase [Clostridiales bacterium]
NGESAVFEGVIEGIIAEKPEGEGGFGYDPIFYVPEYRMTTAQMTLELKNEISHRGKALRKMYEYIIKSV